jgi:YidC/Oxa1 family membrane protein insertase
MHSPISNFLLLAYPILNVLVAIYHSLIFLHIPYALGFSIIILTIVIRLILYPLTGAQLKASKKMQELTPHLNRLKEKHKNDAKMLQQETMKLYKEFGVNPLAGCLPIIIQLPLIYSLYQVLQDIVKYNISQINLTLYSFIPKLTKNWDLTFFGLPLAQNPSHLMSTMGPLILLIPVMTGVLQFIQTKMMFISQPKPQGEKKGEKKNEDFATAFQSQSLYIFPLMIAFFSYGFPIGLSLYWNTFTIFGIIQQYKISGLGGLKEWTDKLYGKKSK